MTQFRQVAITIALVLVTTVSAVRGQDAVTSGKPVVRSLSWFESIYVPDTAGREDDPSRLTRELRDRLLLESRPYHWAVVDSIGSTTARTVVATAKPDSSGIVIEFSDVEGNSIAAVRGSTIRAALGVLLGPLSTRTTYVSEKSRAPRPIGAYPMMLLRYQGEDKFNLAARLRSALRERGPWRLVDSLPAEDDPRRLETVECVMWHLPGVFPTAVTLRCRVPLSGPPAGTVWPWEAVRAENVLSLNGVALDSASRAISSWRSTKTRTIAATDDLTRKLLEHVELEQRIYSPQR